MEAVEYLRPIPFTDRELDGAAELRRRYGNRLDPNIDSDYFLARWWRSCDGDLVKIDRQLVEFLENRRLLACDVDDLIESMSDTKSTFYYTLQHFSCSYLDGRQVSDDVCVFVQKMRGVDLKQVRLRT
jgi:hypothetical protein